MEELYPIAVEIIDSNGQGLQGQAKIYLITVLSVGIEDKVCYQIFDDFRLSFWNLIFILLHNLIWVTLDIRPNVLFELSVFRPIVAFEICTIVLDLISLLRHVIEHVKLQVCVPHQFKGE